MTVKIGDLNTRFLYNEIVKDAVGKKQSQQMSTNFMFLKQKDGEYQIQTMIEDEGSLSKDGMAKLVTAMANIMGSDAVVFTSEAYVYMFEGKKDDPEAEKKFKAMMEHVTEDDAEEFKRKADSKKEAFIINIYYRGGVTEMAICPIIRDSEGTITEVQYELMPVPDEYMGRFANLFGGPVNPVKH